MFRGCTHAELLVMLLVFGLMWTCGGLAMQTKLDELRRYPGRGNVAADVTFFAHPGLHALPQGYAGQLPDEGIVPRATWSVEAASVGEEECPR